jgi:2-polyprenyl-6-hydroxyphenyl methylase/3-demethylubiquinone-9 3-methyltransferase
MLLSRRGAPLTLSRMASVYPFRSVPLAAAGRRSLTSAPPPPPPPHASAQQPASASASASAPSNTSTVDASEISKFVRMSAEWWSLDGKFAPLHAQNPTRVGFIREHAIAHFFSPSSAAAGAAPASTGAAPAAATASSFNLALPLRGLRIADIGCGGGLLSEPLARLGAEVTGVDAAPENIGMALAHRALDPILLQPRALTYLAVTAEDLLERHGGEAQFDVVCAMEIVEHVSDPTTFVRSLARLLRPGGILFMSTLNRTHKAYAMAILGAEYVLRWLPPGTHDWHKFVTPAELTAQVNGAGLRVREMNGIVIDPFTWRWGLSLSDIDVNYIMCAVKPAEGAEGEASKTL